MLKKKPQEIDVRILEQHPGFVEFRTKRSPQDKKSSKATATEVSEKTPVEVIEAAYQEI